MRASARPLQYSEQGDDRVNIRPLALYSTLAATAAVGVISSVVPIYALSGSAVTQQNATPVPNPDGYTPQQLLNLPAPALGAGTTLGGDVAAGQTFVSSIVTTAVAKLKTDLLILLQQSYTLQVPSAGALRALAGFSGVTVHRSGYATAGDGGAADYAFNATTCTTDDGGSCENALGGGSWQIDWGSVGNVAPLPVFGSKCNGDGGNAAADTTAGQAAAATGRNVYMPVNNYCVWNAPVVLTTQGQRIYGDGEQASKILVVNSYGISGVIQASLNGNTLSVTNISSGTVGLYTVISDTGNSGANGLGSYAYVTAVNGSNPSTCSVSAPCTYTMSGAGLYVVNGTSTATVGSEAMSTTPLGQITLAAAGQQIQGLKISYSQPDSTSPTAYQPAIMARLPGAKLDDIMVVKGSTCVDMAGSNNAGNAYFSNLQMGCFNYGIKIDGSEDSVQINKFHYFPYEMTTNQQMAFFSGGNTAIDMGRTDDFKISDSLAIGVLCIHMHGGAMGGAFGEISNFDFDGALVGIQIDDAASSIVGSGLNFTSGTSGQHAMSASNGKTYISASNFFRAAGSIMIIYGGYASLDITGSEFNDNSFDAPTISANAAPGARLALVGNNVDRAGNVMFNNPWLLSQGAEQLMVSANSVTPTSHGGPFISVVNDTPGNRVFGNSSSGFSNTLARTAMPDSLSLTAGAGKYFGN